MKTIPLLATPSQTFTTQVGGQSCRLNVYQKATGVYLDLYVNDALICAGVIARDANLMVRADYLGFVGDFAFFDTQGASDPYYAGLGTRWILVYLEASDL